MDTGNNEEIPKDTTPNSTRINSNSYPCRAETTQGLITQPLKKVSKPGYFPPQSLPYNNNTHTNAEETESNYPRTYPLARNSKVNAPSL